MLAELFVGVSSHTHARSHTCVHRAWWMCCRISRNTRTHIIGSSRERFIPHTSSYSENEKPWKKKKTLCTQSDSHFRRTLNTIFYYTSHILTHAIELKTRIFLLRKYQKWLPKFTKMKPKGKKINFNRIYSFGFATFDANPNTFAASGNFSKRVFFPQYMCKNRTDRRASHLTLWVCVFGLCRFNSAQLWVNLIMIKIFFFFKKWKEERTVI